MSILPGEPTLALTGEGSSSKKAWLIGGGIVVGLLGLYFLVKK